MKSSFKLNTIVRSLSEALEHKRNIKSLILSSSEDLICKNLFCEKVTQPCICRIENVLQKTKGYHFSIEIIDLSNNNLESLPPSLKEMINLKELNLNDNQFKRFPHEIISKLVNLEVIHLKNNPISMTEIPENMYKNLKILK